MPYLFLVNIFDIINTFVEDNLIVVSITYIIIFSLIFGIGCYKFLNVLLFSYKFEDNKIIKGKIKKPEKVKNVDLAFDTIMNTYMVKNSTNSKAVMLGNTAINMHNIINLINLNMNSEFVNNYFDTDFYKKKIFNNPKLLKETKYNLVYICEGNKKLIIPKLYEGMNIKENKEKESSIFFRVLIRSFLVFCIFFLFMMTDFFIGLHNNDEYKSNINNTCEVIQTNLNTYGYSINKADYTRASKRFSKAVSNDRTSTIKYDMDKKGNVTKVDLELFYDSINYNEEELKYIISTLNTDISKKEINDFIKRVSSCVSGKCSYGKVLLGKSFLKIGASNGFVNIYNY